MSKIKILDFDKTKLYSSKLDREFPQQNIDICLREWNANTNCIFVDLYYLDIKKVIEITNID